MMQHRVAARIYAKMTLAPRHLMTTFGQIRLRRRRQRGRLSIKFESSVWEIEIIMLHTKVDGAPGFCVVLNAWKGADKMALGER